MQVIPLIFLLVAATAGGAEQTAAPEGYQAVTTGDPQIPIDELELRLKPLTRAELAGETQAWLKLLQNKVQEISNAEIAVKYKKIELKKGDRVQDALDEVAAARQAAEEAPGDAAAREKLDTAVKEAREIAEEANRTVDKVEQDTSAKEIADKAVQQAQEQADADGEETRQAEPVDTNEAAPGVSGKKQLGQTELERRQEQLRQEEEERARIKTSLLEYLNNLRTEQTALIDRTNLAINALEAKGGEVEEYRQYVKAVSGIKVDVSDAEATWKTVTGWATSSEGGLRWLRNLSVFILTIVAFIFLSRLAGKGMRKVFAHSQRSSRLLEDFVVVSIERLVLAIGVIIGLASLEVNVGPLLAVIGAAGFVIAFALQNSLGNFASGILILLFRPFDVGDVVEIGGILGKVQSMNLLSVQLNTPDNKLVIVPNNSVWGAAITNVTGTTTRRVDLVFGISYDDDIEKAQRILEQVVGDHALVLKEPETVIQVHELADSSVNFVCRPWVNTADYWTVYWDLTRAVKQRFDREGISIPFPQRDVHLINASPENAGAGSADATRS